MLRRSDISSIQIIGQAAEFDYSGTQAARTLTAESYLRVTKLDWQER